MEEMMKETAEPVKDEAKAKKKKTIITLAGLFIVLGLSYFGYEIFNYESTDDAYVETTTVDVAPKISGEITNVYIDDNQPVKEGDIVATIETNDYEIKLAQASANYKRALLNQQNAKANYEAVQSTIDLAQRDLERYKALYMDGAVSKQELDNAQTNYDNAKAGLINADQAVMSGTETKVADAEISALKAAKDQAELYLSYTNIYAPIDGTVTGKRLQKGMYVNPGTGLFTIVPNEVWVVANYKENQLKHIKEGQIVDIKIDTYPHHTFKGKVDSIQRASGAKSSMFPPENAVGSFVKIVQRIPVKIVFTDSEDMENYKIIPGMSVVPKVHIRG